MGRMIAAARSVLAALKSTPTICQPIPYAAASPKSKGIRIEVFLFLAMFTASLMFHNQIAAGARYQIGLLYQMTIPERSPVVKRMAHRDSDAYERIDPNLELTGRESRSLTVKPGNSFLNSCSHLKGRGTHFLGFFSVNFFILRPIDFHWETFRDQFPVF